MIKKHEINLQKITVNCTSSGFWISPAITKLFNPHKREFIVKNAKTIEEIIKQNKLNLGNYYFSFNADHDFSLFNELQKQSNLDISINSTIIKNIETNKIHEFKINDQISIMLDEKGIHNIFKGWSFFVDKEYLSNLFQFFVERKQIKSNKAKLVWRKKEFSLYEPN